jgi:antitoxin YefM
MIAANFSEFRNNLKKFLDAVENDEETLIIKRSKGKGAVVISLVEYNSIMETMYLLGNEANAKHLRQSIREFKEEKFIEFKLPEEQ